jgi:hypothetical protein
MAEAVKDYSFLNKFQSDFYTSIEGFAEYTNWDIKQNGVTLLINMYKGFPHLADKILNTYSAPFVVAMQSPAILRALQRVNFVNGFSRPRTPQYLYYKQSTKKAKIEDLSRKKPKGCEDFAPEVANELMMLMFMDSKTYDYLKYTEKVQKLGRHVMGEQSQKEALELIKAAKMASQTNINIR